MTEDEKLERFLRLPTPVEWRREFKYFDWEGPDGSSCSLDDIEGIRIGTTSTNIADLRYPANLHDWRYQQGRRKRLSDVFRKVADQDYLDGCLGRTFLLVGFSGWKARKRCWIRYFGLRVFGRFAWKGKR